MRYVDGDEPSSLALKTYGEYGSAELDLVKKYLHPGDTVLQIGAHSGFLTIALAQLVGGDGVVIAVERKPQLFDTLRTNVEASGRANIICRDGFPFTDAEAFVPRPGDGNEGASPRRRSTGNSGNHPLGPSPSQALLPEACRLVYVDTRELAVMPRLSTWIVAVRPVLFVGCNDTEKAARLWLNLEDYYDAYLVAAPLFNPQNYRGEVRNVFGDAQCVYLMFVPKSDGEPSIPARHTASIWCITSASELVVRHAKLPKLSCSGEAAELKQEDALLEVEAEEARRRLREARLWDRLEDAEVDLEKLAALLRAKDEEISLKDRRLSLLETELRALLTSKTWKLTAPLRCLLDLFKRRR